MRELQEDKEIEGAIVYLVHSFEPSGETPKPVILHSIRVGMDLYNRDYKKCIVIAGLLHDLLEDTDVTPEEITSKFGKEVATIVAATTYDESIENYLDRHYEMYSRCFSLGREAVLVKAADILDNSDYYGMGDSEGLQRKLINKLEYFIQASELHIGSEDIHQELADKFPIVKKRIDHLG